MVLHATSWSSTPLSNVDLPAGHGAGLAGAQQHRDLPRPGGAADDREG